MALTRGCGRWAVPCGVLVCKRLRRCGSLSGLSPCWRWRCACSTAAAQLRLQLLGMAHSLGFCFSHGIVRGACCPQLKGRVHVRPALCPVMLLGTRQLVCAHDALGADRPRPAVSCVNRSFLHCERVCGRLLRGQACVLVESWLLLRPRCHCTVAPALHVDCDRLKCAKCDKTLSGRAVLAKRLLVLTDPENCVAQADSPPAPYAPRACGGVHVPAHGPLC